jgi:predicted dehydrogenase
MALRGLVIGTGWAAEGHALALRHAGVEVVALYGRNPQRAANLAGRLDIGDVRSDWREAIASLRPDIVALAATAPGRREMAEVAASQGCHIVSEKPLETSAAGAQAMLDAVVAAGVKHACAPTAALSPAVSCAAELVEQGRIGRVRHAEVTMHLLPSADAAFSWWHRLADGGGILNNNFPHSLQTVIRATRGVLISVAGDATRIVERVAIGGNHADHRIARVEKVDLTRPDLEWADADVENAFRALLRLRLPDGGVATATIQAVVGRPRYPQPLLVHGDEGTLHIEELSRTVGLTRDGEDWEEIACRSDSSPTTAQGRRCREAGTGSWSAFFATCRTSAVHRGRPTARSTATIPPSRMATSPVRQSRPSGAVLPSS